MGKVIKIEKEKLKISAEEHEKELKTDKVSARLLEEWDKQEEKARKKMEEGQ